MEIIFVNQTNDETVLGYEEDYNVILQRATEVLKRSGDWSLSVIFVTPEQIHEINRDYRNVDRPTDVISFAMQDNMDDAFTVEDDYELGDIFINIDAIAQQAESYGHSIRREACFLFCHGLLHLMGYDHMTEEEEKEMFHLQDVILDEVVRR